MRLPVKAGGDEKGAALLIAIFALMLVSVVAIALVVSTGTDSALAGNFRSTSGAYYAAVAGLEEARGRLLWKNQNYLNNTNSYSALLNPSGLPTWGLTQVLYILNPASGDTVIPTSNSPITYGDTEYAKEFSWGLGAANVQTVNSVWTSSSLPIPNYKWVRINAATQQALNIDVNGTGTGQTDGVDLLYYDPAHLNSAGQPAPSLVVGPPTTATAVQVLEITAYSSMPGGGSKLLQYLVAPLVISPDVADNNFPAGLTLNNGQYGNSSNITFEPPTGFEINGVDGCSNPSPPHLPNAVAAVAYTSNADQTYMSSQANLNASDYPGAPLSGPPPNPYAKTTPSLLDTSASSPISLRQSWLSPQSLDTVMQDIVNSADVILGPTGTYFTGSGQNFDGQDIWNAAPNMSASNWMTVVVNGNLTLNQSFGGSQNGYGLLLVTGTLSYHPSASWNGIVLAVGQGHVIINGRRGSGGIYGSMFVAQTRNSSGNFLPNLAASLTYQSGAANGTGIQFNSCSAASAQGPLTYKIISFHEITNN